MLRQNRLFFSEHDFALEITHVAGKNFPAFSFHLTDFLLAYQIETLVVLINLFVSDYLPSKLYNLAYIIHMDSKHYKL